ncbi:MAG: hypothetical protein JO023_00355 [Chloroflexi bacterium]|nr:hypothetical protein [Chloroflexota bacterium]
MSTSVDTVRIEVSPTRMQMDPGGAPQELAIRLQNRSSAVQQFRVEIVGIDAGWYTAPTISVSLFPGDSDETRVRIHPPVGAPAGTYPMHVLVRSGAGSEASSAAVALDLRGQFIYRLDMTPLQQTSHGDGTFRLQLVNIGTADGRLEFAGRETQDLCRFRFPKGNQTSIGAAMRSEVPLIVQPKSRPWGGPARTYSFSITALPLDARGDARTVAGHYTHQPRFPGLPDWGIPATLGLVLVALLLLGVFIGTRGTDAFGDRAAMTKAEVCGHLAGVLVLGAACPPIMSCAYAEGFKTFAAARPELVGSCVDNVDYDRYGNGLQETTNGDLFWQKASNKVYFFVGDTLYEYVNRQIRKLDGSGPSNP